VVQTPKHGNEIVNDSTSPRGRFLWLNSFFILVYPVVAIGASVWYGMNYGITWAEIGAAIFCWAATATGIGAGYHRLFSHKGYKAHASVRFVLAMLGAAAAQNSAIAWCSDHRYHHLHTDTDNDPYNAKRGFWYSHLGWILFQGKHGDLYENVPDLRRDPILAFQHKYWLPLAFGVNFLLVGLCALVLGNPLGMFVIAGMLRVLVVQHFTFCINSLAHIWGKQPYSHATTARDNWFLSLVTLGEGYHNYHHSFQWDYRNGPRWYNWDPNKWIIWMLSCVGLATGLRRTPMDVVLHTRFEEGRRGFLDRLGSWGDSKQAEWSLAIEQKKTQLRTQRDDFIQGIRQGQLALHDQLVSAEAALEVDLAELKVLRQALTDRMKTLQQTASQDVRQALEREVRHLRLAVHNAQRSAKAALRGWERLALEYSGSLQGLPSPSPA
jgi:stearoyl-CoA desaturase (delta-9 desaturase)